MEPTELGPLRVGVIGAGRLGCAMGDALAHGGLELVAASSASADGRARAARLLGIPVFEDPVDVTAAGVDVVVLCVPDDAIAPLVLQLARSSDERAAATQPLRFVHTSGVVSLDALAPLERIGHDVLSIHPLQTITASSRGVDLRGASAAVCARTPAGVTLGAALARCMGLHPFPMEDSQRPLYHAAGAFAANFTVTLLAAAEELAAAAHIPPDVIRHGLTALARSAVDRVERDGAVAALTGPIVRGDVGTVALHIEALDEQAPALADLYRTLAHATNQLALHGGATTIDVAARIDGAIAATPAHTTTTDTR